MKYGEKCNERKNGIRNERETIYMRICLGKVENFKNIVGGAFAHQSLCKNCHWTSATSMDTGCVRDGKKRNLVEM